MPLSRCCPPLLALALLLLSPLLASQEQPAPGTRPVLVASTTQVADFARQIAGDQAEVQCVLAPGADPHTYQPTPADARLVLRADLCLENGLHLEGKNWMATLARDAGKPLVTCTAGLAPLQLEQEGTTIADPHAWFAPRNAALYVRNILAGLERIDPAGAARYRARAGLYLQQLRVLDAWIREQVNRLPPAGRILVTSHDAFQYFAAEYGFQNQAPVGWSTGSELGAGMTPSRYRQVVAQIRSLGVRAVFVETSVNPRLIREVAAEAGVKVGGRLFSDSMGEAGSAAETYLGMLRENVITIMAALAPEGE